MQIDFIKVHEHWVYTLLEISSKHGRKLNQEITSVRWRNSLGLHTIIKQISAVGTWRNRVPNVGRMFHHFIQLFVQFLTIFWQNDELKCLIE